MILQMALFIARKIILPFKEQSESLSLMQCQLCPELSSHIASCVKVAWH